MSDHRLTKSRGVRQNSGRVAIVHGDASNLSPFELRSLYLMILNNRIVKFRTRAAAPSSTQSALPGHQQVTSPTSLSLIHHFHDGINGLRLTTFVRSQLLLQELTQPDLRLPTASVLPVRQRSKAGEILRKLIWSDTQTMAAVRWALREQTMLSWQAIHA